MKSIKFFMLAAAALLGFASCSDDESYNSNSATTIEFEQAAVEVDENTNIFNLPVKVTGERNGDVRFRVSVSETGASPAVKDVNYMLTSEVISLKSDNLKSAVVNVEVKAIDDRKMNDDRTFVVTIEEVQGATLGANKSVTVTLKDNDTSFFNIFSGEWKITGTFEWKEEDKVYTKEFSQNMSISSPSGDMFEYQLWAYIASWDVPGIPVTLSYEFPLQYKYNKSRKEGSIAFVAYETASYLDAYGLGWSFVKWNSETGEPAKGNPTASWAPTEDNSTPDELDFSDSDIALMETVGGAGMNYGCVLKNVKIKRRLK